MEVGMIRKISAWNAIILDAELYTICEREDI